MEFIFKLQYPNASKPSLATVMEVLHEMVDADGEYHQAQLEVYKKDLKESSDELASIQKKFEEQTKDAN
jgi:uncharacterized tellurite resistance protein B-like protein